MDFEKHSSLHGTGSHACPHLYFRGSAAFAISSTCRTWRPCSVRLCHACMLRSGQPPGSRIGHANC